MRGSEERYPFSVGVNYAAQLSATHQAHYVSDYQPSMHRFFLAKIPPSEVMFNIELLHFDIMNYKNSGLDMIPGCTIQYQMEETVHGVQHQQHSSGTHNIEHVPVHPGQHTRYVILLIACEHYKINFIDHTTFYGRMATRWHQINAHHNTAQNICTNIRLNVTLSTGPIAHARKEWHFLCFVEPVFKYPRPSGLGHKIIRRGDVEKREWLLMHPTEESVG
jgi:hypothetical protein